VSGSTDVVVVGAGVAGLACAVELADAGATVRVLESADAVGGCVRTDALDGFLLDRGFQILLTAYPQARRLLDYDSLGLGAFYPGALVRVGGRFVRVADPFRRPLDALRSLGAPVGTPSDKLRLLALRRQARAGTVEELFRRSPLEHLRAAGFSDAMLESFLRAVLVVNGEDGSPITTLCVPSDVAAGYALPGSALVSVVCVGAHDEETPLVEAVRSQLVGWFRGRGRVVAAPAQLPDPRGASSRLPARLSPVRVAADEAGIRRLRLRRPARAPVPERRTRLRAASGSRRPSRGGDAVSSRPHALLTGATGCVGGRLLHAQLERGESVRCLARRPEAIPPRDGLEVVAGDVPDSAERIGRRLGESLPHETVVRDPAALERFEIQPRGYREAIARALRNEDEKIARTRWSDALSPGGAARQAFAPIRRIGGDSGWYYADTLWRLRGFLDLLAGGVGLRRGRRDPETPAVGSTLDFWRVEAYEPDRLLRLAAEMRVPGQAWLQFEVEGDEHRSRIRQTAIFDPTGLAGLLYWYTLLPFHRLVFAGMLDGIALQAAAAATADGAGRPAEVAR
jgi:Protein of unknown function (DUF2867)/NAD(P)-binding Rossmann-like domain